MGLKLIRDKKPDMEWDNPGAKSLIKFVADDKIFSALLLQKLLEELGEFVLEFVSGSTEETLLAEAADVVEVLRAILDNEEIDPGQLEVIRRQKLQDQGGFTKRLAWGYTERKPSDANQTAPDHLQRQGL